jgi:TorA maturation chaperone TorD
MNTVQDWLSTAVGWRWTSLLFQSPTAATHRDLRLLAAELPEAFRDAAHNLAAVSIEEWQSEFHRILGPGGCPATESSYDDNILAGRGPLLADIAGFYEAFAYRPSPDSLETPDHLANELGFASFLALKVAYALYVTGQQEKQIAEDAYWRFLETHLLFWSGRFCEKVTQTGSALYLEAAALLSVWVKQQSERELATTT